MFSSYILAKLPQQISHKPLNILTPLQCLLAQKALKHRRVKHYGFEFRYDNNNVDKDKPLSAGKAFPVLYLNIFLTVAVLWLAFYCMLSLFLLLTITLCNV